MKRKMFIVVLIIFAIVLPLTAKSAGTNPNYIGGSFGGAFSFQTDSDVSYTINGLAFGVEGANFFGKQGNIGVEYSIGGISTLSYKRGDTKLEASDQPLRLDMSAAVLYRYPVSKTFSIAAGLGAGFTHSSRDVTSTVKASTNMVSLFGDIKAMFNVVDAVKLFGGVKLGGAVYSNVSLKGDYITTGGDTDPTEFRVTPYIGVGFAY